MSKKKAQIKFMKAFNCERCVDRGNARLCYESGVCPMFVLEPDEPMLDECHVCKFRMRDGICKLRCIDSEK